MSTLSSKYRTHTCNQLTPKDVGQTVTLSGWIHRIRDHGGVVFVDLRDNYGLTQLVAYDVVGQTLQGYRPESVITVVGSVVARADNLVNPKIATGQIEVQVSTVTLISTAEVLPFLVHEDDGAPEQTRLKYRFLELRREKLHRSILLRAQVIKAMREYQHANGFVEFQTPILTASSPEGARDFLVPSRLHPGKFYALPQAPQQFKQLLMVSGFDRYFQIAPCFRDEDARADRSAGEFYQIDMEFSFVEEEDVLRHNEGLMHTIFSTFANGKAVTTTPFPRFSYRDSIATFGSDKPDLRNPLRIADVSSVFAGTEFRVFKGALEKGGSLHALPIANIEAPSRKYFDEVVDTFTKATGNGVAYIIVEGSEVKGSIAKFVTPAEVQGLREKFKLSDQPGKAHLIFLAAVSERKNYEKTLKALGQLLAKCGRDFNLMEQNAFRLCWVVDMPFYEEDHENGGIQFGHNPFSMPKGGLQGLRETPPLELLAHQYDCVCNGYELSSGAIRNHDPELMYEAFAKVGYDKSVVDSKFGGMIRAFKFGAPPHGGIAFGIDRIVMLLGGEEAIREVIAFPLNQQAEDLLMNAPSEPTSKQLREVHLNVVLPQKAPAQS